MINDYATKRASIIITELLSTRLPEAERLRWLRDRIAAELRDAAGQPQSAEQYTKTVLVFREDEGVKRVDQGKTRHFVELGEAISYTNGLLRGGANAVIVPYRKPKSRIDYMAENEEQYK